MLEEKVIPCGFGDGGTCTRVGCGIEALGTGVFECGEVPFIACEEILWRGKEKRGEL